MKLRTELSVSSELECDPFCGVVFLGSCFSNNIGEKIKALGLPCFINPFGVIFHPYPLLDILEKALDWKSAFSKSDLFYFEDHYYSLAHHGQFSEKNAQNLLAVLNKQLYDLREWLMSAELLCLTLGTAWGYEHENKVVGNCHKLPQNLFQKTLTSSSALAERLESILKLIHSKRPDLQVVLTVSPVRHVKDGIIENSRSKAHLLSAVHQASEGLDHTHYFPAYEMVMDDLRDYRFYKSDLIHPNDVAVNYIYEQFKTFAFKALNTFTDLEKFSQLKKHQVMSSDPEKIASFQKTLEEKTSQILKAYPKLYFEDGVS